MIEVKEIPGGFEEKKKNKWIPIMVMSLLILLVLILIFFGGTLFKQPQGKLINPCPNASITFIYSQSCIHCQKMLPIIKELKSEGTSVLLLDVNDMVSMEVLKAYDIVPSSIPVEIINCRIYYGEMSKEKVLELLK